MKVKLPGLKARIADAIDFFIYKSYPHYDADGELVIYWRGRLYKIVIRPIQDEG